jgi:hypothetical protein
MKTESETKGCAAPPDDDEDDEEEAPLLAFCISTAPTAVDAMLAMVELMAVALDELGGGAAGTGR